MIAIVYGTRPEAIKLGPVVAELRELVGTDQLRVICTDQHDQLLSGTPADTDLAFSRSLKLGPPTELSRWLHGAVKAIGKELGDDVDVVVVQGDTISAYAGALAAKELAARVRGAGPVTVTTLCHVEAGVRSHHEREPWPEERFRVRISELADWHYAATTEAAANLMAEGHTRGVLVTGNPVVSALWRYADPSPVPPKGHVVITLHRRELTNRSDWGELVSGLYGAIAANPSVPFLWPVHPRVRKLPMAPPNLRLMKPRPYKEMVEMVRTARALLTDSGGLQEEAATLGTPVAVFRNVTDRPEAVAAGIAQVFPPSASMARAAVAWAVHPPERRIMHLYGTPDAASIIATHIARLNP